MVCLDVQFQHLTLLVSVEGGLAQREREKEKGRGRLGERWRDEEARRKRGVEGIGRDGRGWEGIDLLKTIFALPSVSKDVHMYTSNTIIRKVVRLVTKFWTRPIFGHSATKPSASDCLSPLLSLRPLSRPSSASLPALLPSPSFCLLLNKAPQNSSSSPPLSSISNLEDPEGQMHDGPARVVKPSPLDCPLDLLRRLS